MTVSSVQTMVQLDREMSTLTYAETSVTTWKRDICPYFLQQFHLCDNVNDDMEENTVTSLHKLALQQVSTMGYDEWV